MNAARIGHRYPTFAYEISRAKVREYAAVTEALSDAHSADPRVVGDAEVPVPPTFAACFTLGLEETLLADPELGAHWNLVHAGQTYSFHRQLRIGDLLDCTPWIVDVVARGRLQRLVMQLDVVDGTDATPVLQAQSTIVFFDEDAT